MCTENGIADLKRNSLFGILYLVSTRTQISRQYLYTFSGLLHEVVNSIGSRRLLHQTAAVACARIAQLRTANVSVAA